MEEYDREFEQEREFDLSTFESSENFQKLLDTFHLRLVGYGPFDIGYMWSNADGTLRISTGVNPLTAMRYFHGKECPAHGNGYASYTTAYGSMEFIEAVTQIVKSCK